MSREIYLVRHGQTEWNAERRMQGQWNSDLNELGRAQAHTNAELLAGKSIDAIIASPLGRTRETAAIISARLGVTPTFDDRIKEWNCGDWSGYLYAEVAERWPEEWRAWNDDRYGFRGPRCENYPDMFERASPFVEEVRENPAERLAIVSHGMIGRVMISILLGLDKETSMQLFQPNDWVFHVTLAGDGAEVSHYIGGEGPTPGLGLVG